uniref:BZIP domain-containing protein n=1 Tax=Rhizochromulina marina TaxID=1034831 RepID=A0A7S2W4X3_9STRA|mmetsp:Transcript_14175/g.41762  ORF Transcript_14175/g.41762 Transcript_14175/m.41762 type:complete len:295 (+) Transcript_14175:239-1123(+)
MVRSGFCRTASIALYGQPDIAQAHACPQDHGAIAGTDARLATSTQVLRESGYAQDLGLPTSHQPFSLSDSSFPGTAAGPRVPEQPPRKTEEQKRRELKRAANRRSAQLSRQRKRQQLERLTDEHKALKHASDVLATLSDLVIVLDSHGIVQFASPAATNALAEDASDAPRSKNQDAEPRGVVGSAFTHLLEAPSAEQFQNLLDKALASDAEFQDIHLPVIFAGAKRGGLQGELRGVLARTASEANQSEDTETQIVCSIRLRHTTEAASSGSTSSLPSSSSPPSSPSPSPSVASS